MLPEYIITAFARYFILIPAILIIYLFLSEKNKTRKKILVYTLVASVIAIVLAFIFSQVYFNPRPFVANGVEPLFPHSQDNGFPSNHALFAATISAVLFLFSRKLSLTSWIATILIGFGRVLALVHHSIDIIASIAIAIFSVWLTKKILK